MSKKIFSNSSLSIYFRLLTFVKKYWLTLAIGVFATILASAISALIIWSVKPIINKGLIAHNTHFLTLLPFLIIGIFIAQGIFNFISNYSISRVGRTVVMEFRQRIFKSDAVTCKLPRQTNSWKTKVYLKLIFQLQSAPLGLLVHVPGFALKFIFSNTVFFVSG